jgi:hypothetical protein
LIGKQKKNLPVSLLMKDFRREERDKSILKVHIMVHHDRKTGKDQKKTRNSKVSKRREARKPKRGQKQLRD